jgi:hypothetical protein
MANIDKIQTDIQQWSDSKLLYTYHTKLKHYIPDVQNIITGEFTRRKLSNTQAGFKVEQEDALQKEPLPGVIRLLVYLTGAGILKIGIELLYFIRNYPQPLLLVVHSLLVLTFVLLLFALINKRREAVVFANGAFWVNFLIGLAGVISFVIRRGDAIVLPLAGITVSAIWFFFFSKDKKVKEALING